MRIAIIGTGVSGLSAAWALNEHASPSSSSSSSSKDAHSTLTLFESAQRVGGHSNTVRFQPAKTHVDADADADAGAQELQECDVDTGFIVFNEVTYPNFLRFLKHLRLPILASDMSFSVSRSFVPSQPFFSLDGAGVGKRRDKSSSSSSSSSSEGSKRGAFEWSGSGPAALFCQVENLLDPSHWRMVWDIIRFNHQSLDSLRQAQLRTQTRTHTHTQHGGDHDVQESIGSWLDQRGYGDAFRNNYLIPMTACIWSTPPGLAFSAFPALTLLRFMHNHHLLQLLDRPTWLTVQGGSKSYVDRVLSQLPPDTLKLGEQGDVVRAKRDESKGEWMVRTRDGKEHVFDKVIFACHADQTRSMLSDDADPALLEILSHFDFNKNEAVLHSDERLMPVRRNAWSAWNFLAVSKSKASLDEDRVTLTYWMNLLQSLSHAKHGHVLVTLNPSPDAQPAEHKVRARYAYEHPLYTARSVRAQEALKRHQGKEGAYFVGAWTNYGFHEDGFSSGLRAACALGARPPFEVHDAERALPPANVSVRLLLHVLEAVRRFSAPWLALLFAPVLILFTLAFEAIVQPFQSSTALPPPAGRGEEEEPQEDKAERVTWLERSRNVRMFWEAELSSKWALSLNSQHAGLEQQQAKRKKLS